MRILGLDFGSFSVKAVEMDSAFGRYEIHDYHEQPIVHGGTREEATSLLLKKLAKTPDRIVVAMNTGETTFRNLTLPTRDKKAIQTGIRFELEDELPFQLDDSVFDYAILSQTKQGSIVHTAATLKRHVTTLIEVCHKAQIQPDVFTTEAWVFRTLLNRVISPMAQKDAPILLVQMGHEKTTLYLHWKGAPALVRDISWGGKDLTQAIAQKFNLSWEQAETAKIEQGFTSPAQNASEFRECLEGSLHPLMNELKQVELVSRSITHHTVSLIHLSGGSSLLPGLYSWIEQKLNTPVKPLLALSSITTSGVTYSDQTDARFLVAVALTLSQIGADRALCINFRKGPFAKEVRSREISLKGLRKPILATGVVLFSLFASLIVQSSVYHSQLKTIDTQLERSVRSFFGQVSPSGLRTYMSNPTLLKSSITKEMNKQRELSKLLGPNLHSPLEFLNSLSNTIPKDIVVDLIQFQTGTSPSDPYIGAESALSTSMAFLVSNPQQGEKLANVVGSKISNLQRGKMEEVNAPDGSTKKWKITFSGKPNEDNYGK